MRRHSLFLLCLAVFLTDFSRRTTVAAPNAVEQFFTEPPLHEINIEIAAPDLSRLQKKPRENVPARLKIGIEIFDHVALHLKGATGSFRPITENPSLTVDFAKLRPGRRVHGLDRLYLNNSVEDPSRLNELLGSELFRAAGIPAPRVSHARVAINGRPLGLYVIKEGFTEEYLETAFKRPDGNLYDTDLGHDVDQPMKRHSGAGSDTQADLKLLTMAASEPDKSLRWEKLNQILGMDRFLKFMALEVIICHKDGYCLARNNFRLYHDPDSNRMVFLPSGMDQLFTPQNLPWQPQMAGLVARAILDTKEGQAGYRETVQALSTNLFHAKALNTRVDEVTSKLRPYLGKKEFADLQTDAVSLKERINLRSRNLQQQLNEPEPAFLTFHGDSAEPTGWTAVDSPSGGKMEQSKNAAGATTLEVIAGPITSASWRAKVLLRPGRYSFEAKVNVQGFQPLETGKNQGAALRIGGEPRSPNQAITRAELTTTKIDFVVKDENATIELVCEYRARSGRASFESPRIIR